MSTLNQRFFEPHALWAPMLAFGLLLGACGGGADVAATLALPSDQPSRVSITPALDLGDLEQLEWTSRLVIEHITLNLEDVRLLGADPRIPAGGLELMDRPQVIAADGRDEASLRLPFPSQFVSGDDLAVFLRVAPSAALEGASVEVFARLYASAPAPGPSSLSAVDPDVDPARPETGAVDPDVDPARPDGDDRDGAVDPDVDPARGGEGPADGESDADGESSSSMMSSTAGSRSAASAQDDDEGGAVDPDVDPARTLSRGLISRPKSQVPSVLFVLRDDQVADMVATLGAKAELNVVVGIPASRWFTPTVLAQLPRTILNPEALSRLDQTGSHHEVESRVSGEVIEIRRSSITSPTAADRHREEEANNVPYFLTSEGIEGNRLRR